MNPLARLVSPFPEAIFLSGGVEPLRVLASHGVRTIHVGQGGATPTDASRSVIRSEQSPIGWSAEFDNWFNAQEWPDGAVVIPGDDDSAWWIARRQDKNEAGRLLMATPGLAVLGTMLPKHRLTELCREHGIATPRTWLVTGDRRPGEAADGSYPMVLKPQSRVGLKHWTRGRLVRNDSELEATISWFRKTIRFDPQVVSDDPLIGNPLLQEFVVRPRHEVYHLLGYRSRDGESVFAAHRKLLQYPLRFGSGLCFESETVDSDAAERLERLLVSIGFHGIFEAEYVERDGVKLLIDLNPRSYNGLSLETRRGYALPWYLYLDTIGERELLRSEMAKARALNPPDLAWRDSVRFWTMLAGQSLSGGLRLREMAHWVRWSYANRKRIVDPYFVAGDRRVGFAHVGEHLKSAVRHPRAFLGTYVRRGLDR